MRRPGLTRRAPTIAALLLSATLLACGAGDATREDGGPPEGDAAPDDGGIAVIDAQPVRELTAPAHVAITCAGEIPVLGKADCQISIAYPDGEVVYAGPAGVGLHGRSSLSFPKKQYAVELRNPDGSDLDVDLFGMGAEADWLVGISYLDRSLVRNKLGYDLFRAMGRFAPETRFAELTVNGTALGVVLIAERVDRGDERVDMPADDGTGRAFIVKGAEGEGIPSTVQHAVWEVLYPKVPGPAVAARLAAVDAAVTAGGEGIFAELDLDGLVDFVILEELLKNNDAYWLSQHAYTAADGRLHMVPWDLDLTLGQPSYNDNERSDLWLFYRSDLIARPALVPSFRARLIARWQELRQGVLATDALLARIATLRAAIGEDAIARNWAIWDITQVSQIGFPLYPVTSADEEYERVGAFLTARLAWIDAHIAEY